MPDAHRYAANWQPISRHWADYGVQELLQLGTRTNNLLERWFHTWKYDICGGKVSATIHGVISCLFERVMPRLIQDRALKQAGAIWNNSCQHFLLD